MLKSIATFLLVTLCAVAISPVSLCRGQVLESDSLALVAIFDKMGGPNWDDRRWNWKSGPVSSWYHVQTRDGRVVGLNFKVTNMSGPLNGPLQGEFPAALGDLTALEVLNVEYNHGLTGGLPIEIGQLKKLKELRMFRNGLSKGIPEEIGELESLETLRLLDIHEFSTVEWTPIPSSIGQLTQLEGLWLMSSFSGPIPESIAQLGSLERLVMAGNRFNSTIPESLSNLSNLEELVLSHNGLKGDLPPSFGGLLEMTNFEADGNELIGGIPPEWGQLQSLSSIIISRNPGMKGVLPLEMTHMTSLVRFYFEDTGLCVPDSNGFQSWMDTLINVKSSGCTVVGVDPYPHQLEDRLGQSYPNPSFGIVTIPFSSSTTGPIRLTVFNVLGQVVFTRFEPNVPPGKHTWDVNLQELPAGAYMYRLSLSADRMHGSIVLRK